MCPFPRCDPTSVRKDSSIQKDKRLSCTTLAPSATIAAQANRLGAEVSIARIASAGGQERYVSQSVSATPPTDIEQDSYIPKASPGSWGYRALPPPHAVIPPVRLHPNYVRDIPDDDVDELARLLDEWKEEVDLRRSIKALEGWSTNGNQNFRGATPGTIIETVHVEALGSTQKNPFGSINRGSTAYGKVFHGPHPNIVLSRHIDINGHGAITMAECGTYGGRAPNLFYESKENDAFAFLVSANKPRTGEIPKGAKVFEIDTFKNCMCKGGCETFNIFAGI